MVRFCFCTFPFSFFSFNCSFSSYSNDPSIALQVVTVWFSTLSLAVSSISKPEKMPNCTLYTEKPYKVALYFFFLFLHLSLRSCDSIISSMKDFIKIWLEIQVTKSHYFYSKAYWVLQENLED